MMRTPLPWPMLPFLDEWPDKDAPPHELQPDLGGDELMEALIHEDVCAGYEQMRRGAKTRSWSLLRWPGMVRYN